MRTVHPDAKHMHPRSSAPGLRARLRGWLALGLPASLIVAVVAAFPPVLEQVLAQPAAQAPSAAPARTVAPPLDGPTRARIVDSVARVLEARYVDGETATRLGARLRARLAAGAYDGEREPPAFGAALMRDLQAVVRDKHLRVSYEPGQEFALGAPAGRSPAAGPFGGAPVSAGAAGGPRREAIDGRDSVQLARINFAFERVERLPGNVGYLKIGQFFPLVFSGATATSAMRFLAGSDAVIVDLRDNVGGSPDLVEFLLSYFYGPEPVTLTTSYARFADARVERRTLRDLPSPRLDGAELFVLTNGNSASAAETFAYAARRTGRGTLVGETTAGAGNGGAKLSVGAGLVLFVPQFRVISGPGFEQTGVAPHVAVPGADAFDVAVDSALARLAARDAAPEVRRERAWALEWSRALRRPYAATAGELRAWAGRYGARTVVVEGGSLASIGATGWRTRLVPVAAGEFRARDARFRFERSADGVTLAVESLSGVTVRTRRDAD